MTYEERMEELEFMLQKKRLRDELISFQIQN